jgi:hypothetical protein
MSLRGTSLRPCSAQYWPVIGTVLQYAGLGLILAAPLVACLSLLAIPKVARGERGRNAIVGPAAISFAQLIAGAGLILLAIPIQFDASDDVVSFIPELVVTGIGLVAVALALRMIRGST